VHPIRPILLLTLGILLGCYPDPTFPEVEPDLTESAESGRDVQTAPPIQKERRDTSHSSQELRHLDIQRQLERIGASAGLPRPKRPGADEWRPVELEKLTEIVTSCCSTSDIACRGCLGPLTEAKLASDELWEVYGAFLGPLQDQASAGVEVLGAALLQHPEGLVRDRALRVAVGSGVLPRPEESAAGYRGYTLPRYPRAGEPALIIVEHSAPCTEVQAEVKGPDPAGRIDLELSSPCEGAADPETTEFVPKATRYVYTHRVDAFPTSGVSLWIDKGEAPLLRVTPVRPPDPSRDPG
jgi:hypothetical protein